MASIQTQFENLVVGEIKTVTGWTGAGSSGTPQVVAMNEPDAKDISFPGAMVFPLPEKSEPVTNKQDDNGYGVGVIMAWRNGQVTDDAIREYRRLLIGKFRQKQVVTAELVISHRSEIEYQAINERIDEDPRYFVSALSFHFFVRETRT